MKFYFRQLKKSIIIPFFLAITFIIIEILFHFTLKDCILWSVIYNFSLSFISAFVFYLLVVHIKEQKDKENINGHITKYIILLINSANTIKKDLEKKTEIIIDSKYPTLEDLQKTFSKINVSDDAPLVIGGTHPNYIYANWFDYFIYHRKLSLKAIDKILLVCPFLDTEFVKLIVRIESNPHYVTIESINNVIQSGKLLDIDKSISIKSISEYFELINQLDNYYKKNLS